MSAAWVESFDIQKEDLQNLLNEFTANHLLGNGEMKSSSSKSYVKSLSLTPKYRKFAKASDTMSDKNLESLKAVKDRFNQNKFDQPITTVK